MNGRPKRVPRLWCALQGLLPLESCLVAQRAELAWPAETGVAPEECDPPDQRVKDDALHPGPRAVSFSGKPRSEL